MRFVIPLLLCAAFVTGPAYAQQTGGSAGTGTAAAGTGTAGAGSGTAALSPNNCGTPDEPKPCGGTGGAYAHRTMTHKTSSHTGSHSSSQKTQ
jgi:hypothetical protein